MSDTRTKPLTPLTSAELHLIRTNPAEGLKYIVGCHPERIILDLKQAEKEGTYQLDNIGIVLG